MDYGTRRTGRENATVFVCAKCGWESDPIAGTEWGARANACDYCRKRGLQFVRWESGVEDAAARALIDDIKPRSAA